MVERIKVSLYIYRASLVGWVIPINGWLNWQAWLNHTRPIRHVHESSQVGFGPNPNSTFQSRVKGRGTQNRPLMSIGWVGFGFGWYSSQFRLVLKFTKNYKSSLEIAKLCWHLQIFHQNLQFFAEICCDLARSS